ncbi:hypothetical protein GCM10027610_097940 [Dactylosporangium cerinum]
MGEAGDERDRAHRALTRVQGLLGPDAVLTAVLDGGRADSSRIRLVAFGDERVAQGTEAPWPGRLPSPSPATVYPRPLPAEVTDKDGQVVRVSGRLELSGAPESIQIGKDRQTIVAWAGPWPVDERWWDEEGPAGGPGSSSSSPTNGRSWRCSRKASGTWKRCTTDGILQPRHPVA